MVESRKVNDRGSASHVEIPHVEGVIFDEGGVMVAAFKVTHTDPQNSYGLKLEAFGRTLIFSGDTKKCDALIENAQGADAIIHEAFPPAEIYAEKSRRHHAIEHPAGYPSDGNSVSTSPQHDEQSARARETRKGTRPGRSSGSHFGESGIAENEQIGDNNIDDVGSKSREHWGAGIARAAIRNRQTAGSSKS